MSKNKSSGCSEMVTHLGVLNKFKRLKNPLEPSLGIVGFLFVAVLFIGSCFYLDYRAVTQRLRNTGQSWLSDGRVPLDEAAAAGRRPGFLDEGGGGCDVFDGNWVWDERYPLYESRGCALMDEGFRCSENGRPDSFYTKWRWQPKMCDLPRFDAKMMLERLHNRRVIFVGDSIGRNQWESLLCMLSSALPDKAAVYEVNGRPITKHTGFLVYKFRDFNCTVEYYRSPFLVVQGRAPAGSPEEVKVTLKLDQIDWTSNQWADADLLVLNTGHWWNYEKTVRGGSYFQVGNEVKMNMTVEDAYQRSLETVLDWISGHVNMSKSQVYFRSYAPVHFRGGDWRSGGTCHLETLPDLGSSPVSSVHLKILTNLLTDRSNQTVKNNPDVLNITAMTARRKDGHSSLYYLGPELGPASVHRQDCSHWCLPGVPDVWNELLYAFFLKHDSAWS
ncbi:PMR5N domain-containing protein [Psidium guajava]|nr:PMR5N domain-containing protein [Psidium guajava]